MQTITNILGFIFFMLFCLSIKAQNIESPHSNSQQMVLLANAGIKHLPFNNLFDQIENNGLPIANLAYTLGASTYFNKKELIFKLDFNSSYSNAENKNGESKFVGFSTAGQLGYNLSNHSKFVIAPLAGFNYSTNSFSTFQETENLGINSIQYTNSDYSLNIGSLFEYITPINMSIAVELGYNISLNSDSPWGVTGSTATSGVADNQGGFYISFLIGGHISLK